MKKGKLRRSSRDRRAYIREDNLCVECQVNAFPSEVAAADVEIDSQPLLLFKPSYKHDEKEQFTANFITVILRNVPALVDMHRVRHIGRYRVRLIMFC